MQLDELIQRFARDESYRWVPLSALKRGEYLSCIDGRSTDCVVAAPGGDLGEFILLVTAYEEIADVDLTLEETKVALRSVMDWHGRFYMHTDTAALEALGKALADDRRFDELMSFDTQAMYSLSDDCPPHLRFALEEYLMQSDYIGCGFLNILTRQPERFRVRAEVVRESIVAFYENMWSGSTQATLTKLEGVHREKAVITMDLPEGAVPDDDTHVPSICGCDDEASNLFVDHRAARRYMRRTNLELLMRRGELSPDVDKEAVLNRADELAAHQIAEVLEELAPDLPAYLVIFDEDSGEPEITRLDPGLDE